MTHDHCEHCLEEEVERLKPFVDLAKRLEAENANLQKRLDSALKQFMDDRDSGCLPHIEELKELQSHLDICVGALRKINMGRHGELSTVEMALIAYAALEEASHGTS